MFRKVGMRECSILKSSIYSYSTLSVYNILLYEEYGQPGILEQPRSAGTVLCLQLELYASISMPHIIKVPQWNLSANMLYSIHIIIPCL